MAFSEYLQREVLDPAGLTHTGICTTEDIVPGMACGYSFSGEGPVRAPFYDLAGAVGSGNMYATAGDLAQWLDSLTSGQLLSEASVGKMTTPHGFIGYLGASYGYGCFLAGTRLSMNGLICGFHCQVARYADLGLSVILLSNNDTAALSRLERGILQVVSGEQPTVPIRHLPMAGPTPGVWQASPAPTGRPIQAGDSASRRRPGSSSWTAFLPRSPGVSRTPCRLLPMPGSVRC